jgi:hypothetical protein
VNEFEGTISAFDFMMDLSPLSCTTLTGFSSFGTEEFSYEYKVYGRLNAVESREWKSC